MQLFEQNNISLYSVFCNFIEDGNFHTKENLKEICDILESKNIDFILQQWNDKIANDGVRKIVFIFDTFVIKLTSLQEIQEEEKRKKQFLTTKSLNQYIFLPNIIYKLNSEIFFQHPKYHFTKIDCICLQKRINTLSKEQIFSKGANKTLIINRKWLIKFIQNNYNKTEQSLLNNFLFSIDLTNNNIGYDENNNPILYDW